MKTLKNLVVAALCFVLIFALCACQDPAGGNGNGGTAKPPEQQQPIKDAQIDEGILEISADKIVRIDNLESQKVDEQGWKDAIDTHKAAKNFSMKEVSVDGDNKVVQTFKYALVNGNQHTSVQRTDSKKAEIYFGVYESGKYFSYSRIKDIADGSTKGWVKSEEAFNVSMFTNVKIMDLKPSYLNELFEYSNEEKCYVAKLFDGGNKDKPIDTLRVKFEDGKIVYIEQQLHTGKVFKTYLCDFDTTTVQLPSEIKNLFNS